jgi:hypothetical protein
VGFAALVALVGLLFSMISIKLMSIVENAQILVIKSVRGGNGLSHASRGAQGKKIVVFAISTPKLVFLRIGIIFFGRISAIIFLAEAMYPEKVVERAAFAMMKTVLISNKVRVVTVRHGRHAIRKIKMKNNVSRSSIKTG